MSRVPYPRRRDGRYLFRRRVFFRNLVAKLLCMALQTAYPKGARERALVVSARF